MGYYECLDCGYEGTILMCPNCNKDAKYINIKEEMKYPEVAENCEEDFIVKDFELICGKRNNEGKWMLCKKCSILNNNKDFIKAIDWKAN